MKNRIVCMLAGIGLLLPGIGAESLSAQQVLRFGYINSQRIMMEAPGTSEAQNSFEQEMERFRLELERMEAEIESLQTNLERQQATLTPAVRQERQQDIQQRFVTYQQRRQELEDTAQRRQAELIEPIMRRISDVIEEMRQEGNYSMIFDASAGTLITADPSMDLTEQVLQRLRTASR